MAIYHLEAKVISRGAGRSAVGAAAYISCSQIYNDYDGIRHDFTRKQGLVWQQVFLPDIAPTEWLDRAALWNAVEETEKTKDSRLAREFVVALPLELSTEQQKQLLTDFIQEQFVSDGMCADVAIHDTDGHNPHAHIMLTVRPLDEKGKWQYKTEKEYLCIKGEEEKGFTAAEFKIAQAEGWEKQYQYKVGKKKVYLTHSEAEQHGYQRVNKYPKSTKYGRQNPISERWNSDEQLILWREAWATTSNHYLELAGCADRIDHRSHAERGLDEQPTVHEGYVARNLEKQGIIADRCELNRQIKADNTLLRELKAQIKKLMQAVETTVPALANAMESVRTNLTIICYQLGNIRKNKPKVSEAISIWESDLTEYKELVQRIKETKKERKSLIAQKKETSAWNLPKLKELSGQITELTELLEELQSEKLMLLASMSCEEDNPTSAIQKTIKTLKDRFIFLETQEARYTDEMEKAMQKYDSLQAQAKEANLNPVEIYKARLEIQGANGDTVAEHLREVYGKKYSPLLMMNSQKEVDKLLNGKEDTRVIQKVIQMEQQLDAPNRTQHKKDDCER